jgi:hypothetical protein
MPDVFLLPHEAIRVNTRNEWLHGEDLINANVSALFARHIEVQTDGTYAVKMGDACQRIEVDDTPFWVTLAVPHLDANEKIASIMLKVSDGQHEMLDPTTLMQSADNVLYCRIKRGPFKVPCRFAPHQYHELALHAQNDGDGYYFNLGGTRYAIAPYDRRPKPM